MRRKYALDVGAKGRGRFISPRHICLDESSDDLHETPMKHQMRRVRQEVTRLPIRKLPRQLEPRHLQWSDLTPYAP
jgi:hypothetical protein